MPTWRRLCAFAAPPGPQTPEAWPRRTRADMVRKLMDRPVSNPTICLALETSGRVGSVVLGRGDEVLEVAAFSAARRHAVELLPTVQRVCRAHGVRPDGIEEVYVSGGPGSFTGLRVGVSFARTVALEGRVRVVRVPTLDIIAQNALAVEGPPAHLAVVLDAKRGRVYAAAFELDASAEPAYRRTTDPAEVVPSDFLAAMPPGGAVIGEGINYHRAAVDASELRLLPEEHHQARADAVYRLGRRSAAANRYDDPRTLTPIYVRRPEAEEVYERRHGKHAQ